MHEKRSAKRYPYEIVQQVAIVSTQQLPDRQALQPVRCIDLSASGLAFFCDERPDSEELVVVLGKTSEPICLLATVTHVAPDVVAGRRGFRVGCRFTTRVQWSESTRQFLRQGDIESAFTALAGASDRG